MNDVEQDIRDVVGRMQRDRRERKIAKVTLILLAGFIALVTFVRGDAVEGIYFAGQSILYLGLMALPLIIAWSRQHRNTLAIGVLNIVGVLVALFTLPVLSALGLVLAAVVWLVALVWSCTSQSKQSAERTGGG
jgi:hypothetical protein